MQLGCIDQTVHVCVCVCVYTGTEMLEELRRFVRWGCVHDDNVRFSLITCSHAC